MYAITAGRFKANCEVYGGKPKLDFSRFSGIEFVLERGSLLIGRSITKEEILASAEMSEKELYADRMLNGNWLANVNIRAGMPVLYISNVAVRSKNPNQYHCKLLFPHDNASIKREHGVISVRRGKIAYKHLSDRLTFLFDSNKNPVASITQNGSELGLEEILRADGAVHLVFGGSHFEPVGTDEAGHKEYDLGRMYSDPAYFIRIIRIAEKG